MIFGKTYERDREARQKYISMLEKWHPVFFLTPRRIQDGRYVWLCWGERRYSFALAWGFHADYRIAHRGTEDASD